MPRTEGLPHKLPKPYAQRVAKCDADWLLLPLLLLQPVPMMDAEREALEQRDAEGDTVPERDVAGEPETVAEPLVERLGGTAVQCR